MNNDESVKKTNSGLSDEERLARDVASTLDEDIAPAYDRDALAAAVIASQERAAYETEQAVFKEAKRAKNRKKAKRTVRNIFVTIILLGLVFGAVYAGYRYMANYYDAHFLSGTTINGADVSGMTAPEVKKLLFGVPDDYQLTIYELNGDTEVLTSDMIGRAYVDNDEVEQIMTNQDSKRWFLHLQDVKEYTVTFVMAYDREAAQRCITNLHCISGSSVVTPQDAHLETDASGMYYIVPEVEGNTVNSSKVEKAVMDALDKAASSVDLVAAGCYEKPRIHANDENLIKRMNAWNEYLKVNVTYRFGPYSEVINADTIRPYIQDTGTDVILATDWIKSMVYGWGQKYDTFGLERAFRTHDGQLIQIPAGGDYGWCLDKEATIADVTEVVKNGLTGDRDPIWLFEAYGGWTNGDLGGTYFEVSINEQRAWLFEDGVQKMEIKVITGTESMEDRKSTPGCFAIDGKITDWTLGTYATHGYQAHVDFWLPFNGDQGIHDAYWYDKSAFGTDRYKYGGSHGCVSLYRDDMEKVYPVLEIGMPVIVYREKIPAQPTTIQAASAS